MKKYKNLDYAKFNQTGDVVDGNFDEKEEFEVPTRKGFESLLKRISVLESQIKKLESNQGNNGNNSNQGNNGNTDYYGKQCLTDQEEKKYLLSQKWEYKTLYSLYNKSNEKRRCRSFKYVYSTMFGLSGQTSKTRMCKELLEVINSTQ